jgi:hypothetical protein
MSCSRKQCRCKRGLVSRYDDKCGHCRNRREQKSHWHKLRNNLYPPEVVFKGQF